VFTISVYCVEPAAPFVSGGRQEQLLAWSHGVVPNGRQAPSKFAIGGLIGAVPRFDWITGSWTFCGDDCGCNDSLSRLTMVVTGCTGKTGRPLTAGETPS
jgi:hypothetical protein